MTGDRCRAHRSQRGQQSLLDQREERHDPSGHFVKGRIEFVASRAQVDLTLVPTKGGVAVIGIQVHALIARDAGPSLFAGAAAQGGAP